MASPFTVFRRHQKWMIATLGLLAMIAFVFLPIVMKTMDRRASANPVVVTTDFGNLRQGNISSLRRNRQLVRHFIAAIGEAVIRSKMESNIGATPENKIRPVAEVADAVEREIGPATEQAVVDTWVCAQHAERLGLVVSNDAINQFIKHVSENRVPRSQLLKRSRPGSRGQGIFEQIGVSDLEIFELLRHELLAMRLRQMFFVSLQGTTPAQRWDYYNRLQRHATIETAAVPVANYIAKVTQQPEEKEIEDLFEKHKAEDPDPSSPDPGFRKPHRISVAYFKADIEKFTAPGAITQEQVQQYYQQHEDDPQLKAIEEQAAAEREKARKEKEKPPGEKQDPTSATGPDDAAHDEKPEKADRPTEDKTRPADEKTETTPEKTEAIEQTSPPGEPADEAKQSPEVNKESAEDAAPSGEEAAPSGEEAAPSGEEAAPSGEDAAPSGEEAAPSGEDTPAGNGQDTPAGKSEDADRPDGSPDASSASGASPFRMTSLQQQSKTEEETAQPTAENVPKDETAEGPESPPGQPQPSEESTDPAKDPPEDPKEPSEEPKEPSEDPKEPVPQPAETPPEKQPPPRDDQEETAGEKAPKDVQPEDPLKGRLGDVIRQRLANQKIDRIFDELLAKMKDYHDEFHLWEAVRAEDPSRQAPVELDFGKLAKQHGLTDHRTSLISKLQATDSDVGRSLINGDWRLPFTSYAFKSGWAMFLGGVSSDIRGNRYLFWKVSETVRRPQKPEEGDDPAMWHGTPEYDDPGVRQAVLDEWRKLQARELALQQAEDIAETARKAGKSLKDVFAGRPDVQVTLTTPFGWMTRGMMSPYSAMAPPRISSVPGVEVAPGHDFMRTVFTLDEGQVGVAMNQAQSISYVVRVVKFNKSEDQLWDEFTADLTSGLYRVYAGAGIDDQRQMYEAWQEELRAAAGLQWQRRADRYRQADQ